MASSLAHYYSENSSSSSQNIFEPARTAFKQALESFKQRSVKDPETYGILQATSLRDVLDAVATAQNRYKDKHTKSKARICLTEFSKRICYYGKVMDVLVQHHPEYVALAWGAMKLIFGVGLFYASRQAINDLNYVSQAIVEHENLGRTIVTGLCDVADALPRVELAASLYPTNAVKQAVSVLYAHIIKFLLRALEWYDEGKIARALHSITKPAALRYDDLIEDIRRATRSIADLAVTGSQAEQRDIHHEQKEIHYGLQALTSLVKQLKEEMLLDQSLKASALLECHHALSDIQLTQALTSISSACSIDYKSCLQASLLIRDKHRLGSSRSNCTPFWTSSELQAWNTSQHSSLITLRGTFKNRFCIRDFCTNIIEQLLNARIAVLWVLKPRGQTYHPISEILKSLIQQALGLDYASHTDSMFSFQLRQFVGARSEDDYLNLLCSILRRFKVIYIIIEAGAMEPHSAVQCQEHLRQASRRLSEQAAATVMRIMSFSYGPGSQLLQSNENIVLKVGKTARCRGKKLPCEPLQGAASSPRQQMRRGRKSPYFPFHARGRTMRAAVY